MRISIFIPKRAYGIRCIHYKQIGNINTLNDGNLFSVCIYITFIRAFPSIIHPEIVT